MQTLPILPFAIVGVLALIAAGFWFVSFRRAARLRSLQCPQCKRSYGPGEKHWMKMDASTGKMQSGVTLRCVSCETDFDYTDSLEFIGPK